MMPLSGLPRIAQPIATTRLGARNGTIATTLKSRRPGMSVRATSHAMKKPAVKASPVAASAIQNVVTATDHTRGLVRTAT